MTQCATPSRKKNTQVGTIVGSITNDIVYNADLDDSLFRFDVPKGYTVKTQKRHLVTEQEMIDYFRILVDFNDKVFPDQTYRNLVATSSTSIRKCQRRNGPPGAEADRDE